MADRQLASLRDQLKSPTLPYSDVVPLLSKSKLLLLQSSALTPSPNSPAALLPLAREILEQGALHAIRARDAAGFTRYVDQLEPFYSLPPASPGAVSGAAVAERNKITGLYLLLLLSQSRYSEFHSELEALATREGGGSAVDVEGDRYLGYPIRLERWLMEGSYDRVWKAMKKGEVPCEEYGVFSDILTTQIRNEIASSSERAYPSLPLSSTKSLLFLDSEGAVVDFARARGWTVRDGQIFFPAVDAAGGGGGGEEPERDVSQVVIENTLGYARQLETIV